MNLTSPPVHCLAYTADRGWHAATVPMELVVACELKDVLDLERPRAQTIELTPCGHRSTAVRHRRRGEPVDPACDAAEKAWNAARNRRYRQRAVA